MKKNKKLHQLGLISAITSSILIASSIAVTVPLILNTNNNTNTLNDTNETKMVTTGNITHDASVPVVNSLAEVDYSSLKIGDSSSIIVNQNGKKEFYVWGYNEYGQLGLGDNKNYLEPTLLDMSVFDEYSDIEIKIGTGEPPSSSLWEPELEPEKKIQNWHVGSSYAKVTRTNGNIELYTWGLNKAGQLGLGNKDNTFLPKLVDLSKFGNFDKITILGDGGFNVGGSGVGANSTFIIAEKNGVKQLLACGSNYFGQLGIAQTDSFELVPSSSLGNYTNIIDFQINASSVAIIVSDINGIFSLYLWGCNKFGQLGFGAGDTNNRTTPELQTNSIFSSDILKKSSISIGTSSCLWNENEAYVWGENSAGSLGLTDTSNRMIPEKLTISNSPITIKKLTIDQSSYALVSEAGFDKIYVWGYNSSGRLGLGNINNQLKPSPFNMSLIGNPISIKSFNLKWSRYYGFSTCSYALVTTVNGIELYGWGQNFLDILGVSGQQNTPIRVSSPSNLKIIDAVITSQVKMIVENNGVQEAYAWGSNNLGQIGNGSTLTVQTPTQILSTKESTPSAYTNKTFNLSAGDALKSFYGELTNIYNKNELLKYIDISTLPTNANLSIDPANTIINSSEGVLDLTLVTDSYYELFKNGVVNNKKSFQFAINGFLKVSDIPIVTKITPNITNENFFQNAVVGNTVNRNYLSQFINLDCIPADAILTIEPIKTDISSEIKFVLKSNKVYKNNGVSTNENYSQTFSFTMKPGIDPILVIGLIAGGCFLLLLIFVIVYMSKSRIRKI